VLHDVHAHLTDPRLLPIVDDVVARAVAAGVGTIVSNGLNPVDNARVLELARRFPQVKAALGLYPVDAVLLELRAAGVPYEHRTDEVVPAEQAVAWLAEHVHEAFAVGEIGLDHHWVPPALHARQEDVFRSLLRLAKDARKAVIVHSREAEARTLEVLREEGVTAVDWHCFGGRSRLALEIARQPGHYLSIPANARRSNAFRKLLAELPRDRVLLETDCPYLGPERDVTNEPGNVAITLRLASELWGLPEERVVDQLADNFAALFG
jgi:TatD DNase family protein